MFKSLKFVNILNIRNLVNRRTLLTNNHSIYKISPVFYKSNFQQLRLSEKWTFRSDYELNPVTDPSKLRNNYTRFYNHAVSTAKSANIIRAYFIFIFMLLCVFEVPNKLIKKLEIFFGSKTAIEEEERLDSIMEEEPERVKRYFAKADGKSEMLQIADVENDANEMINDKSKSKKTRVGFRDSRIIAYEDRIRSYSTPDKIFRYFATVQDMTNEVYMTPEDFVRSITPGVKQPEGLGLDSFHRIDFRKEKLETEVSRDSVFYLLGENALINFSDYVFLLTVISTPQKQFEIAFRMFDLNGDGELDLEEFDVVRSIIRSGSPMGKRHRDNIMTGNSISNGFNSSLSKYFFGKRGEKKLTINEFSIFQRRLQKEIMMLEFNRYSPENGIIKETDFADSLLMYADFHSTKKKKFLRRVRQKFNDENSIGISFDDYFAFSQILKSISDIDTALTFYNLAGAPIDQGTLKHVSKAVANVDLNDHLIDIVFTLFDENNDGQLSNKEFIMVMKQRLFRGLDRPMDTGFIRLMSAVTKCSRDTIISVI